MIIPTKFTIHTPGNNLCFGESNINVELQDDGGGYYVAITDNETDSVLKLYFDQAEELFKSIKMLKKQSKDISITKI